MKYDPQLEKRVWQRVQQSAPPELPLKQDTQELPALMAALRVNADAYLRLSKHLTGSGSAIAQRLYEETQAQIGCLRGIHILMSGSCPDIPKPTPQPESVSVMLRRCYGSMSRCLSHWESRMAQQDFGHVFALLAEQSRRHCALTLQLMGQAEK